MKTAIVRHILVKDKDTAEQLKKRFWQVQIFPKLPNNIRPVTLPNVVVNSVK